MFARSVFTLLLVKLLFHSHCAYLIYTIQSFAKNAGLYGERVGALHVVGATSDAGARVKSQLSVLQRSEISNPPTYGARIVRQISLFIFPLNFIDLIFPVACNV